MGKNDNAMKLFFSNKDNFISVLKMYYGWDVKKENVEELSERLLVALEHWGVLKNKCRMLMFERNRDAVKVVRMGGCSLIVGLENQQYMDFSEPIRIMLYDAMEYDRQRRVLQLTHRELKDLPEGEYVSGFSRKDKVLPVRTIVIYYGSEEWKKPRNLSDIWTDPKALQEETQDYHIDVLDVRRLTDEQINKIESEVRLLFGCVKYDADPVKMNKFVEKNKIHFQRMTRETFLVIAIMTKSGILQEKNGRMERKRRKI